MDFKKKYFKYKQKYLKLKIMYGGGFDKLLQIIQTSDDTSDFDISDVNINKVYNGKLLLLEAVKNNRYNIVKLLLEKGADLNRNDSYRRTALMYAIIFNNIEIVKLLLEKGANVDSDRKTALMYAIETKNIEIVTLLLEKGANVNYVDYDSDRKTALMYAIEINNIEIVKFLLEKGANVNDVDSDRKTTLMYAIVTKNIEIVTLLLEKGADLNRSDSNRRTALMYAFEFNNIEIIKLLLEKGADSDRKTVLMYAIESNNTEIVKLLYPEKNTKFVIVGIDSSKLYNKEHYYITDENKKEWIKKQCSKNAKILGKLILDITRHVPYEEFHCKLLESISKIPLCQDYCLFILKKDDAGIKSNLWISAILIDQINKRNIPINIIHIIYDGDMLKNIKNKNIIICDDASYSGSQIHDEILPKIDISCNIYIIVPFISNPAIKLIESTGKQIHLLNTDIIETFQERCEKLGYSKISLYDDDNNIIELDIRNSENLYLINSELNVNFPNLRKGFPYDIETGSMPIYFDHKIADYVSTFPIIYQLGIIHGECPTKGNHLLLDHCDADIDFKKLYDSLDKKDFEKQCLIPYYKRPDLKDLRIEMKF